MNGDPCPIVPMSPSHPAAPLPVVSHVHCCAQTFFHDAHFKKTPSRPDIAKVVPPRCVDYNFQWGELTVIDGGHCSPQHLERITLATIAEDINRERNAGNRIRGLHLQLGIKEEHECKIQDKQDSYALCFTKPYHYLIPECGMITE